MNAGKQQNDLLCFLATERDWALSNKITELQDLKEDAAMWSSGYQSAIESVLAYIEATGKKRDPFSNDGDCVSVSGN